MLLTMQSREYDHAGVMVLCVPYAFCCLCTALVVLMVLALLLPLVVLLLCTLPDCFWVLEADEVASMWPST